MPETGRSGGCGVTAAESWGTFQALEAGGAASYLEAVLRYLFATADVKDTRAWMQAIHTYVSPKLEESVMTLAQLWKSEGRREGLQRGLQKGLQRGLQQGLEKGRQETIQALAFRLLQSRKLSVQEVAEATTGLSQRVIMDLAQHINSRRH